MKQTPEEQESASAEHETGNELGEPTDEPVQVSGAGCLKLLIVAIIIAALIAYITK